MVAAALVACGGAQPTPSPPLPPANPPTSPPTSPSASPAGTPVSLPTPGCCLDPSLSDAGIAARVIIANDGRADRNGMHEIYGVGADGSSCSASFDGSDYTALAWDEAAPEGEVRQFSVTVTVDRVPTVDGTTPDITDGRVSFDFVSDSGVGTTYTGDATGDDEGSAKIGVTRSGASLTFDFEGVTYDNASFAGQLVCARG